MENKRAIQEKPCQERSMNLKFTAETRTSALGFRQFQQGCSVALHRCKRAAPWTQLSLEPEPCSGTHSGLEMLHSCSTGTITGSLKSQKSREPPNGGCSGFLHSEFVKSIRN